MPIVGPSSYGPVMLEYLAHWQQCNTALPAGTPLLVRLPKNVTVTRAQFDTKYLALLAQQAVVQSKLTDLQLVRGTVLLQKTALLERFNQFTIALDAYWQGTNFILARPYAPGITFGQEAFTSPLIDAMLLWEKMNAGAAPAGVTLPLTLLWGMTQGEFASAISALQFAYREEKNKAQDVILERGNRNKLQDEAYEIMKAYREVVPKALWNFPVLVETMPRLTPLPGHTPQAVNASAIFEAPDKSKVVHDSSPDPLLQGYQLRGCIGPDWNEDDAVVVGTHPPNEPREFITTFGLNQPGVQVVFKLYVILSTGNEAGSAPMAVQRPFSQVA